MNSLLRNIALVASFATAADTLSGCKIEIRTATTCAQAAEQERQAAAEKAANGNKPNDENEVSFGLTMSASNCPAKPPEPTR